MKKIKFTVTAALFIAAAMLLSGCGSAVVGYENTNELPEGMTFEDMCGILSVNGNQLKLPTTIEDVVEADETLSLNGDYASMIDVAGDDSANMTVLNSNGLSELSKYTSTSVLAVDETFDSTPFMLFGSISFGDDAAKVRELLGEPSQYLEGVTMHYSYREEDTTLYLMFGFGEDEKIYSFNCLYTEWAKL